MEVILRRNWVLDDGSFERSIALLVSSIRIARLDDNGLWVSHGTMHCLQARVWLVAHVWQGKMFLPSGWNAELLNENLPTVSENLPTVSENLPIHVWQAATYAPRQTRAWSPVSWFEEKCCCECLHHMDFEHSHTQMNSQEPILCPEIYNRKCLMKTNYHSWIHWFRLIRMRGHSQEHFTSNRFNAKRTIQIEETKRAIPHSTDPSSRTQSFRQITSISLPKEVRWNSHQTYAPKEIR